MFDFFYFDSQFLILPTFQKKGLGGKALHISFSSNNATLTLRQTFCCKFLFLHLRINIKAVFTIFDVYGHKSISTRSRFELLRLLIHQNRHYSTVFSFPLYNIMVSSASTMLYLLYTYEYSKCV